MKKWSRWAVLLLCASLAGGCQCIGLTEHYSDLIDDVADHQPTFDRLYHPCFDLTRIGQPDWCCCWFNRLWCHGACTGEACDDCRAFYCPFCAEDHPPYVPPRPAEEHLQPPAPSMLPKSTEGETRSPESASDAQAGWLPRRRFSEPLVIPSE